jgi:hypothetical protein
MPGHIALHAALLQYQQNAELTRIRVDHGEPHSFTFEREALPMLEHMASCVMVERELAALQSAGGSDVLANIDAVRDFDFHVLCGEGSEKGLLLLLPLAEVTGNEEERHTAAAWTAPDLLEVFLAADGLVVKEGMRMAKMKGTALLGLMQIEQTNAGVERLSVNPTMGSSDRESSGSSPARAAANFQQSDITRLFGGSG